MKVVHVKASDLVEDFDLYPRGDVDSTHVAHLLEALMAGNELPPLIACKKTKRLADGFHRRRTYMRKDGPDAKVPVIFKDYKNDAELYADAMQFNSGHGRRLTAVDYVRCAAKAKALGIDDLTVAKCLHLTVAKVGQLVVDRSARVTGSPVAVPLKRTIRHMAGKELSKRQVEANDRISGMQQVFYVNQVIELIESDLLDKEDDSLFERLKLLHTLLDDVLAAK